MRSWKLAGRTARALVLARSASSCALSLDRSLSLEAFLRHYPSRAVPEIVGLINGWNSGVVFPAGALVKRVVNGL